MVSKPSGSAHMGSMTTIAPGLQALTVAVLKVETLATGRSRVTFRTARSRTNPSGIETAHTAPLTTDEGRAVSSDLRRRIRTWPLTHLRSTAVGISFEELPDGSTLRTITTVGPAPVREARK